MSEYSLISRLAGTDPPSIPQRAVRFILAFIMHSFSCRITVIMRTLRQQAGATNLQGLLSALFEETSRKVAVIA